VNTRLLVVRLGSLGDLVHTLPAVAGLRRAFPAATIDWLVDAPHRDFLSLVPVVSSLIVLKERGAAGWLRVRRELRAKKYDTAIDFQGLIKSAALARMSGARRVVGFDRPSLREPLASLFYSEQIHVDAAAHVVQKNMQLATGLGAIGGGIEFPISPVTSDAVARFLGATPAQYALINPGAAWPNKRWPPDRFGEVSRLLRDLHGLAAVVLWGPGEESLAHAVVETSDGAASVAPPTGLHDLIALARGARLVVSGDTGPLHIAAALDVPAVALFGPTDAARNGPWDAKDVSISKYATCSCHYERRCNREPAQWCLGEVQVADVAAAIDERLKRSGWSGKAQ
jgi:lipopolysaccharide heptosyltransferase I